PTEEERQMVPHHLVEFLNPDESFSVARWCELARARIDEIIGRGHVPIIVGGTGLFIDSLVDNIIFEEISVDNELRQKLMEKSEDDLYNELLRVDPKSAENIHKNNKKRVVRALELYYSGSSKTQQNMNSRKIQSPYEALYFFINYCDRQKLYDRINKRVDIMLDLGIIDEARGCMDKYTGTSAQAIGHKELMPYIKGADSLESCVNKLKQETRRYAKRQITWFKRRENAVLLEPDIMGYEDMTAYAVKKCEEFLNGRV
ncbi:MAG: tRNA (adenosine(37)-N6)-dimethylallyltransferase MiaA, partial [Eubacterium sp.]|nr:tRNA (adenosine(37)-N6)-dimethylallyltransferase MiaA [Eubacterium sp.]